MAHIKNSPLVMCHVGRWSVVATLSLAVRFINAVANKNKHALATVLPIK
ncbi:MAG: hypothetical protein HC782_02120 [Gammaproteobacteria bacterium]|nr:hypothetical protein [Gammaproteobacteria bacterium]